MWTLPFPPLPPDRFLPLKASSGVDSRTAGDHTWGSYLGRGSRVLSGGGPVKRRRDLREEREGGGRRCPQKDFRVKGVQELEEVRKG